MVWLATGKDRLRPAFIKVTRDGKTEWKPTTRVVLETLTNHRMQMLGHTLQPANRPHFGQPPDSRHSHVV